MRGSLSQSSPGLTPPVFHILLALADGERHGYAIGQDVAVQTDGRLDLGPGTLYGCLKRMLTAALVEESDVRPDPALDDERRRYYRLTRLVRNPGDLERRIRPKLNIESGDVEHPIR